jgi:hypothetical protein
MRESRMLKKATAVPVFLFLLSSIAIAQNGHFDFSGSEAAIFTNQASGNGITQTATKGAGWFATFRIKASTKHSFAVNYGRGKNSQIYKTFDDFHVLSTITEYSFTYMYTPFKKGRFEPFLLAGAGVLRFAPGTQWVIFPPVGVNIPDNIRVNLHATKETQLGYLYGAGFDYRLPRYHKFAIRLQYRGILYKAPDFHIDANAGNSVTLFTGARGHMAEPSVGLVYKF